MLIELDVSEEMKEQTLIKKLQQCCIIFDFNDPSIDVQQKDFKTETLHELVDFISSHRGVITENVCSELISMVSGT